MLRGAVEATQANEAQGHGICLEGSKGSTELWAPLEAPEHRRSIHVSPTLSSYFLYSSMGQGAESTSRPLSPPQPKSLTSPGPPLSQAASTQHSAGVSTKPDNLSSPWTQGRRREQTALSCHQCLQGYDYPAPPTNKQTDVTKKTKQENTAAHGKVKEGMSEKCQAQHSPAKLTAPPWLPSGLRVKARWALPAFYVLCLD